MDDIPHTAENLIRIGVEFFIILGPIAPEVYPYVWNAIFLQKLELTAIQAFLRTLYITDYE